MIRPTLSGVRFRFETGPLRLDCRWVLLAVLVFFLDGCAGFTTDVSPTRVVPHSVMLSWTPSTSTVSGYCIYRATEPSGPFALLSLTLPGTTQYTDTGVETGRTYFYFLTSFDSANVQSLPSNEASVTIPIT